MHVVNDLSFLSLITGATIPVQLVMLILLLASGFSWWYIFIKVSVLKSAELAVDEFENRFWTSGDLNKLHDSIHSGRIKSVLYYNYIQLYPPCRDAEEVSNHRRFTYISTRDIQKGRLQPCLRRCSRLASR